MFGIKSDTKLLCPKVHVKINIYIDNLAVSGGLEIHVHSPPQASISLRFVRNHQDDHLSCHVCDEYQIIMQIKTV